MPACSGAEDRAEWIPDFQFISFSVFRAATVRMLQHLLSLRDGLRALPVLSGRTSDGGRMGVPPPSDKDFRSLYQATLTPLRRYLATVLANSHEAQDIAHDAYLRTYTAMQGQEINQPKAFLFTTARRLALNFRLRRGNRMRPEENAVLDRTAADAPDAAQIAMARQEREAMAAAIARLPQGCRTVLVLRNLEGMSHQEIALRLELSRSTVEKHLARALHLLREALAEKPLPPTAHES